MKSRSKKYYLLLSSLIVGWFLFTGQTEPNSSCGTTYRYTKGKPSIGHIEIQRNPSTLYDSIFVSIMAHATGTASTSTLVGCRIQNGTVLESSYDLKTRLTIKNSVGKVIKEKLIQGGEVKEWLHLNLPGEYEAFVTCYTFFGGGIDSSVDSKKFNVVQGTESILAEGKYTLSRMAIKCPSAGSEYVVAKPNSILNGSYIEVTKDGGNFKGNLHTEIKIPSADKSAYPCLQSDYSYDAKGELFITKANGKYTLTVKPEKEVSVKFNTTFDGSNITISGTDDKSANYSYTFTK